MTELEMMARIAVNPLVQQYRKAVESHRNRMVTAYGPNFDDEYTPKSAEEDDSDPRGIKIMTDRERSEYNRLHIRMNAVRKLVREHYSKQ